MINFQILHEKTIEYSAEHQLYLMLIQDNTNNYFEVNDRSSFIGRINFDNVWSGREIFPFLYKWIYSVEDFTLSKSLIQLAFNNKYTTKESVFLLHLITGDKISYLRIKHLKKLYDFEVDLEFVGNTDTTKNLVRVIHVTFPTIDRAIGKFIREKGQNEFQFILNTNI